MLPDPLGWLLSPSALTPHGFCLLAEPWLIWSYVVGDTATGLAYFVIPLVLIRFVRRRRDIVFKPVLWLFAAFILLCGTTRWLELFTIWVPAYHMEAALKLATAGVAVATTVALWRLITQPLALPSPAQMRTSNEALKASEVKLRTYFRDLADGIVVLSAEPDGSFIYDELNRAAERLLCTTNDAARGKRPDEVWPPAHARAVEAHLRECAESGRPLSYAEVVATPEGERRDLFVVLTPLRDGAGQVREVIKSLRDVTAQKCLEARVRESEAGFRLLTEHASDMVSRVGPDGVRRYVSPAAARLFGTPPETLLGRGMLERVVPEDRSAVEASALRLLRGAVQEESVAFRVLHPERGEVSVEATARILRDPVTGALDGYVAVTRDVTTRRRLEAEREARAREAHARELERSNSELERLAQHLTRARDEAERANRAKSRFLAGMSHELRTPLNGILGYAQLLHLEGGLSAMQKARVEAMLDAGRHLLEMINQVLDLSEVETERAELRTSEVDLHQVAHACLDLVRPVAERKALSLSMAAAPGTPRLLTTDPTRLRQVLVNLLGNAVKFTAKGWIELRMRVVEGGGALRIEIADTGPGIPADSSHRLFNDFERLGAQAGPIEGAGLGLALSARLAKMLGGCLGHEDNPGGGSVFWLELPVIAHEATEPVLGMALSCDLSEAQAVPTIPARCLRVLLVDDVAMNRDVAAAFLQAAGHEITCVEGGAEAVVAAAASDFDVILMDVHMPEVDGLKATRHIRALTGPRGQVPIIALTAHAFAEQEAECRRAGMDGHLSKPFAPDALFAAVARAGAAGRKRTEAHITTAEVAPVPPTAAYGAEIAVLDVAAMECTTAFLTPEAVTSYLRSTSERSEVLLGRLRAPNALAGDTGDLAEAAHALAGSAGMFGFKRLATVARGFERAVQTGASDLRAVTDGLAAAIEASLPEMHVHSQSAIMIASTEENGGVRGDPAPADV